MLLISDGFSSEPLKRMPFEHLGKRIQLPLILMRCGTAKCSSSASLPPESWMSRIFMEKALEGVIKKAQ